MPSRSKRFRRLVIAGFTAILPTVHLASAEGTPSSSNVVPMTVLTPHGGFNRMVVSVTVCAPDTDRCATIDDVMVDTGSTGLRLKASAVPPSLRLSAFLGPEGAPLAECVRFVHDTAWGTLHRADIHIGGMTASGLAIQVIADDGRPQPAECPISNVRATSNGTLGISPWLVDCPGDCEQSHDRPGVFLYHEGSWLPWQGTVPLAYRVPNPAALFPDHGNGIAFDLPRPLNDGSAQVAGTLTFGLGTAPDTGLDGAGIIELDRYGRFTTVYGGRSYPASYIDSGTETYLIPDGDLPRCDGMPWAYCAVPERRLSATVVGSDGAGIDVPFVVGDYRSGLARHVGAWDRFAESSRSSREFVWGAPFFFGRRVLVLFDGKSVPGADGTVGPAYGVR